MSASPTPNHESSCGAVTWATRRSRSTSAVGRDRLQRVFTHHAVPPRPVAREHNCAGCGALQFRLRKQSGLTGAGVVPAAGGIKTSPRRPTASRGESMTRRKLHFRRGRKVSAQLGNGGLHERPHTRLFPRSRKREGLLCCRRGLPPRGTWNLEDSRALLRRPMHPRRDREIGCQPGFPGTAVDRTRLPCRDLPRSSIFYGPEGQACGDERDGG